MSYAALEDIAYVQNPIISEEMLYTLMLTALILNGTVPLSIRWWKWYFLKSLQK